MPFVILQSTKNSFLNKNNLFSAVKEMDSVSDTEELHVLDSLKTITFMLNLSICRRKLKTKLLVSTAEEQPFLLLPSGKKTHKCLLSSGMTLQSQQHFHFNIISDYFLHYAFLWHFHFNSSMRSLKPEIFPVILLPKLLSVLLTAFLFYIIKFQNLQFSNFLFTSLWLCELLHLSLSRRSCLMMEDYVF